MYKAQLSPVIHCDKHQLRSLQQSFEILHTLTACQARLLLMPCCQLKCLRHLMRPIAL